MFCRNKRRAYPEPTLPIGTTYTITQSGEWECPATGTWQVEVHGGGGGGVKATYGGTGGGSGEIYTEMYTRGEIVSASIGTGGTSVAYGTATKGGTTNFGDLSLAGGGPGRGGSSSGLSGGGSASGSIATAGFRVQGGTYATGGYGNKNNTSQIYGNGGGWTSDTLIDGKPGAVILTYLGA